MRANYKLKRLFVDAPISAGLAIAAEKEQSHYLLTVLRMEPGAELLLFNGRDGEWRARLESPAKKKAVLVPLELERAQPPAPDLVFCFAPIKAGRLDWMVEKAVEMGAGVIQPVMTQFTQNTRLNPDKMQAWILEAAEQCGVLAIPELANATKLDDLLERWDLSRHLVFCDEDSATDNPAAILATLKGERLGLLVGPEGGFSDDERETLRAKPFVTAIPLGPRILRADTAAVAALTAVQMVCGDWGNRS
ncbi:16S rRNA (uracil(1498)-N(3))-methyltransferase [Pseudohoeflea suaedae]|uniref:Ribosomal RNA small subunit methyltransferase E n=1 Tax=Pseudohoeflea suaedae TaxID=877384 RepID=A0A4R5PPC5_9HYPH|nr:16S rRNA (uracil(1498)-N(3))-methyltransferase [Pseudohoeflea suaedae]TDH38457.1 16S rRNA (uracil(1498)-N(3))-methyltransferase [Pseudohoeflea suaedae]